jgi:hypothetical protein
MAARSRLVRCILAAALLVALAGAEVQSALATLNIVWRAFVLSFDNPATQWLDEIASDATLYADPARDAAVPVSPARPFAFARHAGAAGRHDLDSRLTRSPPPPARV